MPAGGDPGHGEPARRPGDPGPPPTPRWVKSLGIALLVLAVVAVLVMLVSGGQHGPGRHGSPARPGVEISASGVPIR